MEKFCQNCGWNFTMRTNAGQEVQACTRTVPPQIIPSNSWNCAGFKRGEPLICANCHNPIATNIETIICEINNNQVYICGNCYPTLF